MTSMPGNSDSRLAAIRSSSGTSVGPPSPIVDEPAEQLLRHLHPSDDLGALIGIAERHRQAQREVRDVWERAPEADRQRASAPGRCSSRRPGRARRARSAFGALRRDDPDPVLGERRAELALEAARRGARAGRGPARGSRRSGRDGLIPSAPAGVDPGLELVVEVRHPDHVELVEVRLPDRAELDPLDERHRRVLGELEDAVVEVEPGELAIEVEGRSPRGRGGLAPAAALPIRRSQQRLTVRRKAPSVASDHATGACFTQRSASEPVNRIVRRLRARPRSPRRAGAGPPPRCVPGPRRAPLARSARA